jgi:hypothetical protein
MFGGLSIKGQSKEETASIPPEKAPAQSSSSGFSFLQSSIGASSGTTIVDNAAAASDLKSGSSSLTGSAFGFMSPSAGSFAATGRVSNADERLAAMTTTAAATAPAPQSIFEGLNTPHSLNKSPEASAEPSSGFSFLSIPSSPTVTAAATSGALDAESNHNIIDATKSTASTVGSSFSFMNSLIATSSSSVASSSNDIGELDKENGEGMRGKFGLSIVQEETSAGVGVSSVGVGSVTSGFSFLSSRPSEKESPPTMIGQQTSLLLTEPPPPSDLLSISNVTLPLGSGVAWSTGAGGEMGAEGTAKKIVKKKRGKRVGIGSSGLEITSTSYPNDDGIPEPSSLPPTDGSFHTPATSSSNNSPPPPPIWRNNTADDNPPLSSVIVPHDSPPMRIKAERAMDKAEEFIREKQKQRNAIALAAERAMQDRAGDNCK